MNSSSEIKNNHFLVIKEHPRNPNKHILPVFQHYYNNPQFSNNPFLNLQSVTLTVYLTYSYSQAYHRFILPSRVVGPNRMSLNDILDAINTYDHISLDKQSISYKVNNENLLIKSEEDDKDIYLYVGTYPLLGNYNMEIPKDLTVYIKLRPNIDKTDQLRLELFEEEAETQDDNKKKHYYVNENSKRAKERKIGYIIKKVYLWKKLYEGVVDRNGKKIKMTLQDAAEKVDISKKSLDEYLNQIKYGKIFGFDFNKHRNDKVGVLRGFVKTQMQNYQDEDSKKGKGKTKKKFTPANNITEINITIVEDNKKNL